MDTKGLEGSETISVGLIRDSPTKKVTLLSGGAMVADKENKMRFQMLVEIDGQQKMYKPNKTTIKTLQQKFGMESTAWIGKTMTMTIGSVNGKEAILGTPV